MQQRVFTLRTLRRCDGKQVRPAYIAWAGRVYDVSASWRWQGGIHWAQHAAGRGLTEAMIQAPHGAELLERFPLAGVLRAQQGKRQRKKTARHTDKD